MLEQTRTNFRTALCLPPREGPRTSYMVVDATGTVAAPVRWRKSTMHAPRNRAPRPALMAALLAATLAACGGDDGPGPTDQSGRLEGQVVIAGTEAGAGPLVGATVTISQIDENSPTGAVRTVAGTVTTDAGGRYGLDVGLLNGLFLVEAAGGSYVEPASGETIALDAAASIRTCTTCPSSPSAPTPWSPRSATSPTPWPRPSSTLAPPASPPPTPASTTPTPSPPTTSTATSATSPGSPSSPPTPASPPPPRPSPSAPPSSSPAGPSSPPTSPPPPAPPSRRSTPSPS